MSAVLGENLGQRVVSRAAGRVFFWCVRREIWENRFIFIAPAAVALVVIGAYLVGTIHLPEIMGSNPRMHGTPPAGLPFSIASVSVVLTATIAGAFYALGSLYNERRDRSILFWKSLPISDRTVVLAKAAIPMVVLPLVTFFITLVMQLAMLLLGATLGASDGGSTLGFWTQWPFMQMAVVMLYCFVVTVLWQAPLWGWLFAVSAWAKRAPFLWAVLPPLALGIAEHVAFNSSLLCDAIINRFTGAFTAGFNSLGGFSGPIPLDQIAPVKFLTAPGLWFGLLVAAGLFWAAIRLRRFQGPL